MEGLLHPFPAHALTVLVAFALLILRMLRSPSFTATVDARTGQMSIVPPASTDPED